MSYKIRWVTENLAVGAAPLSEEDLSVIKAAGITGIVNLCGEFCDLADIERIQGFDVLYLPVDDDSVPSLKEMEDALEWLDEAIFLGKKILIHCRLGLGRTGTFINSYLLRRGFGLKQAQKKLKHIKSTPSSYYQWDLLRKYDKSNKKLTLREPSLESKALVDLSPYFSEYEVLVSEIERTLMENAPKASPIEDCGANLKSSCCRSSFTIQLIEAAYLHHSINTLLSREERLRVIEKALQLEKTIDNPEGKAYMCPLNDENQCVLFRQRPLRCKVYEFMQSPIFAADYKNRGEKEELVYSRLNREALNTSLHEISKHLFLALNSAFLSDRELQFELPKVASGRFVQDYFAYILKKRRPKKE